jgi:hypothetical protein
MFSKMADIVVALMIQKNKRMSCGKGVSVVFRLFLSQTSHKNKIEIVYALT